MLYSSVENSLFGAFICLLCCSSIVVLKCNKALYSLPRGKAASAIPAVWAWSCECVDVVISDNIEINHHKPIPSHSLKNWTDKKMKKN